MTTYSEDNQVEQPSISLFQELGWETINAYHEVVGDSDESTLGRITRNEVVLKNRLLRKLKEFNPDIPDTEIRDALQKIAAERSNKHWVDANKEVYDILRNGLDIEYRDEDGSEVRKTLQVVNWNQPDKNDFLLVSQMWIAGEFGKRRPDLIGFLNGIPLLLFELKKTGRSVKEAHDYNLSDYKDTIPQLFVFNQIILLSNGADTKIGTITSPWEFYSEWKKISDEEEPGIVSLETAIRGICEKNRLIDLIQHFILFENIGSIPKKLLARNHQFLGVNNAIEAVQSIEENKGKLGVFWHTQGSGKSFSMVFFTRKIMRELSGDWKFVIITDRRDLDEQIYKNFAAVGAVTEPESEVRAESKEELKQLLKENHRYVFTLIHKFHTRDNEEFPVLSTDDDIIVITDEAHRTQYDKLAMNMRKALTNAAFLGFTGTPLIKGEDEKTREVFGDYVSVYDFKQSIEDGATVPLYYENRIPELQLTNENLSDEIKQLLDDAMLNEKQEEKLEREFRQEYHLITRKERLEVIAADLVDHFLNRGFMGKGMMICIDRFTAVKMYNLVQKEWKKEIKTIKKTIESEENNQVKNELLEKLHYMNNTDMAVVISGSQNEIKEFEKEGLDIRPHRKRIKNEPLDEKFKDADDPLRLVFVCAMWITGFSVSSLSTLYLDKPMKNHTLMQTIARANRVFEGKYNGLIVDYIGVFRNLQKALAVYATGHEGNEDEAESPVKDKEELVKRLQEVVSEAKEFCKQQGVDLEKIIQAEGFESSKYQKEFARSIVEYKELKTSVDDAVEEVLINDKKKKEFIAHANLVNNLYKAILPDPKAEEFIKVRGALIAIKERIQIIGPQEADDIEDVRNQITGILDESIETGVVIEGSGELIDIGNVDFDKLKEKFAQKKHKRIALERIKTSIEDKVEEMVEQNRSRMDFKERYEEMIEKYNNYSVAVEVQLEELFKLVQDLNKEEQRHIEENLTEEELAVFDIVVNHEKIELDKTQRDKIKEGVSELMETLLQEKLVMDWCKQQKRISEVKVSIEKELDDVLPDVYDRSLFTRTCDEVFDHVYQKHCLS